MDKHMDDEKGSTVYYHKMIASTAAIFLFPVVVFIQLLFSAPLEALWFLGACAASFIFVAVFCAFITIGPTSTFCILIDWLRRKKGNT